MTGLAIRRISPAEAGPPSVVGLAALARMAFRGADLTPLAKSLAERCQRDPRDAAARMDLSLIELFQGRLQSHAQLQAEGLALRRIYRHPPAVAAAEPLKVLALAAVGNLMANTPIEFLLENSGVVLDVLFIDAATVLPDVAPPHDVAVVVVSEGDANRPILERLAERLPAWPQPVLNAPERIARLTREGAWRLLGSVPGAYMPVNLRVERAELAKLAGGAALRAEVAPDQRMPIIARPAGLHAGEGLQMLDGGQAIGAYLAERPEAEFVIAPFVDYRSEDGLFRKYRVALIDGRPYAVHMAISSRWMIHYLNADMIDNARNRAEEAAFMRGFDAGFGARHGAALCEIARRCGLDYLQLDCGETRDGRLLIFEVGTAMLVHSMDPESVFPYKAEPMNKLFGAFEEMLRARARAARAAVCA
jgi:hypothetical protein